MNALFAIWRYCTTQVMPATQDLLADQDVSIARRLFEFCRLRKLVTHAVRQDDSRCYHSLLRAGAEFLSPADSREFGQVIRRPLPKFKHLAPAKLVCLEDQMIPYLCQLELGEQTTTEMLLQACDTRQKMEFQSMPSKTRRLRDVPTLTEFETSLRATQPNKATGLDPIPSGLFHQCAPQPAKFFYDFLLKIHAWAMEPLRFKGGVMCLIPKKGGLNLAKNHRGILLVASIAKRMHGLLRSQLMRKLQTKHLEGQIGGFPGQMVQFGSHSLQMLMQLFDNAKLCSAVLFIDLANAFHRLIREVVT